MNSLADLRISKLQTRFDSRLKCTVHTYPGNGDSIQEQIVNRVEHWKREKSIGEGGFAKVWLEKCVSGGQEARLRAVKRMRKMPNNSRQINYHRELTAITKFSHESYEPYFVKCYGWYENEHAIFIAMEYFELGDLHQYIDADQPISENDARQIALQLLTGLKFMHQSGFAHRDLKPRNILVRSRPPDPWLVKLGDFGISKHAADSLDATSTLKGTPKFMAPELLGFNVTGERKQQDQPQAMAADIWAMGEIAFQMLTKESTFGSYGQILAYIQTPNTFPANKMREKHIGEIAIDFTMCLMRPRPGDRPTALQALLHRWIKPAEPLDLGSEVNSPKGHNIHEGNANRQASQNTNRSMLDVVSPVSTLFAAPTPSGSWTTITNAIPQLQPLSAERNRAPTENTTNTSVRDISGMNLTFSSVNNGETSRYVQQNAQARFYILKSYNETNIETSNAHGIWSSKKADNTKLSNAYNRTGGEVYLIFSVNQSRQFCGVAKMTSPWRQDVVDIHWEDGSWEGGYTVQWLSWTAINFKDVEHLKQREGDGSLSITRVHFITEVCASTGLDLMKRFGLGNLFPQSGIRQPNSFNTIGSLGVGRLNLATADSLSVSSNRDHTPSQLFFPESNTKSATSQKGLDTGVQTLQLLFTQLMDYFPAHPNPQSEDVFQLVEPEWHEFIDHLDTTTSQFLRSPGSRNVSLDTLDEITNIIHMIPEWDNHSRNLRKRRAYEDIARAWAAFIYEHLTGSALTKFRHDGWEAKLLEHNDMSKGLMRAAREAFDEINSASASSISAASTQTLIRKRPHERDTEASEQDQARRAYKALFRR